MNTTQQLELGFNATSARISGRRREERVARAKWWFEKMRAAVKNAWQEQTQPQPQQIFLVGVNREFHA
jgi:hypothetical protein